MGSHPTIVHPFNIPIHLGRFQFEFSGFGIAVLLAFTIAHVVSARELRRRGYELEAQQFGDVLLAAVVGTLVGGKLYFVSVITHDWHDLFSRSGFVYWGGFIGSVIACWGMIRLRKLPFARYADVAGIAIAAGYAALLILWTGPESRSLPGTRLDAPVAGRSGTTTGGGTRVRSR